MIETNPELSPHPEGIPARRTIFWLLVLCGIQFGLIVWLSISRLNSPPVPAPPAAPTTNQAEPFTKGRHGPWGEIEYVRVNIEPPDEYIPTGLESFEAPRWLFPGYSREQLRAFLETCELTQPERAELLNETKWTEATNGLALAPTEDLILKLNPAARGRIYAALSASRENMLQYAPSTFRSGGFDDWFGKSGLPVGTLKLLRTLVYQRGSALCFSDLPQVCSRIPDPAERRILVKTLWRDPTVLMKLRIRPDTDIDAVAAYWSQGSRAKDIRPLLESLTKVPGGATVDIIHLLPRFARKRLNTYPDPADYSPDHAPDCFWTATHFFRDPPSDGYPDIPEWWEELQKNYKPVQDVTFGDIILIIGPDNQPTHAAVYIADEVVFSKNGYDYRQPWVLMRSDDLLARYHTEDGPPRVVIFRKLPEAQ